ncbi:MAG: M48 family metallopeptidase [Thermoanaerobaculaceae bacterium]
MWELIRANQRRSHLLLMAVALLLLATGLAVGELLLQEPIWGLFAALGLWLVLTELAFRAGDKVLLAISGARRIEKKDHPVLFNLVEEMTVAHGLPKAPEIYILDEAAPNAFATGTKPEKSAVVVTSGLLERLSRDELQGVMAHELAHIKHRDVVYLTQMAVMVGSVVLLAELARRVLFYGGGSRRRTSSKSRGADPIYVLAILLILIAPLVSRLMYLALSRRREYLADAAAAVATRYPEGLASALEKIEQQWTPMTRANPVTAPMFIVNPLTRAVDAVETLFSTHPPTRERIRILRSFGGSVSYADYERAFRQVTGRPVGLVPAAALGVSPAPVRSPIQDPRTPQERLRQSTDLLWRLAGYSFILCSCGTTLKVPPVYRGQELPCPQCGLLHKVSNPKAT